MKRERDAAAGDDLTTLNAAETLRTSASPSAPAKSDEESLPVFWRFFGGTILSIAALAVITMYNQLSTNISELRNELARVQESRNEFVKKDDFAARLANQQSQQTTVTSLQTTVDTFKERLLAYRTDADAARREAGAAIDKARSELNAGVDSMKKDLELVKKELTQLENARAKLTEIAAEVKMEKMELAKLRQDVESNRVQDLERKKFRDEQYVKMTEFLKELDRMIRDNSEKIARLEGQFGPPKPKSTPIIGRP